MHENPVATVVGRNEAEAFVIIAGRYFFLGTQV